MISESTSVGIDIRCPCCNKLLIKQKNVPSVVSYSERNIEVAKAIVVCPHAKCSTAVKLVWKPDPRDSINAHFLQPINKEV